MELAQVHTLLPVDADDVRGVLHDLLTPDRLNPWGCLAIAPVGPWRPADVWAGAPEVLVWSLDVVVPEDALLNEEGRHRLGAGIIGRRGSPIHVAEHIVGRLGHGLVVLHSDAGRYSYVAVYRERHLRFSLLLVDSERVVRCDGQEVVVESPPRLLPEGDRAGVLLAGLERLFLEPIALSTRDRLFLVEQLAQITEGAELEWLIERGGWVGQVPQRRVASR